MIPLDEPAIIALAREAAAAEGWPFLEPLSVTRRGQSWHVMTNAAMRGGNVNIWLDAKTGAVVRKAWARR